MPSAAEIETEVERIRSRLDANLQAAEEALKKAVKEPLVEGSTGQKRANPLYEVAREADALVLRYREQLDQLLEQLSDARARELTTSELPPTLP